MPPHTPNRKPLTAALRLALAALLAAPFAAQAHFQELIPDRAILDEDTGSRVELEMRFTHPMARGPLMEMGTPVRFGVLGPAGREDLSGALTRVEQDGKSTYQARYRAKEPGDYVFYLEPAAYWEPAEGVMIVHYTKVVVDGFGAEEGWDAEVGLPVEIEPLVRPYGLWTGNLFQGLVKKAGQPVPFAEIEVEWRNDGSLTAPAGPYVTQVIKADANGVFSYAMPHAGWWGFAALLEGDAPMKNPAGDEVPVEQGALIWVQTRNMK
jgi:cobalt/nickel transport protein